MTRDLTSAAALEWIEDQIGRTAEEVAQGYLDGDHGNPDLIAPRTVFDEVYQGEPYYELRQVGLTHAQATAAAETFAREVMRLFEDLC